MLLHTGPCACLRSLSSSSLTPTQLNSIYLSQKKRDYSRGELWAQISLTFLSWKAPRVGREVQG